MPTQINGLPAHVLLIHAVVVLVPLAAVMTIASGVWPAARRKLGVLTPLVALIALVLVPVTTNAGEWLEHRLPESKAIERHAELGDTLLPWAIGLFVVAAAVWVLGRRYDLRWRPAPVQLVEGEGSAAPSGGGTAVLTRPSATATHLRTLPVWVTAIVAVVTVAVAVGTTVQLYRIGDSGAHAVWNFVHELPAKGGS